MTRPPSLASRGCAAAPRAPRNTTDVHASIERSMDHRGPTRPPHPQPRGPTGDGTRPAASREAGTRAPDSPPSNETRVSSGATWPPSWSAGELWALPAAIAADSFLRGHSERKDWKAILVLFNDIRAFVAPSVAGTSRTPDHLKWQWRHMGSKGRYAERERTLAAVKGKFAVHSVTRRPRRAAVIDLAKSMAMEQTDAVRREAAAVAMRKAEARRERRKLQVRARRAACAAGKGTIETSNNARSKNAAITPPPPLPRGPAPARRAVILPPPPPPPPPVPAKFWPGRLPPVEEVSFRTNGSLGRREGTRFFFFRERSSSLFRFVFRERS